MWYILLFACILFIVWMIAMKIFPHTVTWKEGIIMLVVQSLVICALIFGSVYDQGRDVQIINGEVTKKYSEKVHCRHSYSCNCITTCSGSGSSRFCSTICQTCYDHSYDVDWIVKSNIGGATIDTIDRQGVKEPPRWTAIKIGEPFSREQYYYNYIKASPLTIFNKSQLDDKVVVPSYIRVYDYYRINRVINFGVNFDTKDLNVLLNDTMKKLGPTKKVNLVVMLHNKGGGFAEIVKAKHLGGKINDVYIVLDVAQDGKFNHVAVFSWSKLDIVNVKLRDDLLDIGKFDATMIDDAVRKNLSLYFVPRSIEDFKYLEDDVQIPDWAVWCVLMFGLLFPFVAAWVAHEHEIID